MQCWYKEADRATKRSHAGERLEEPIVRARPFVLNTSEQLEQAFRDYQAGVLDR